MAYNVTISMNVGENQEKCKQIFVSEKEKIEDLWSKYTLVVVLFCVEYCIDIVPIVIVS